MATHRSTSNRKKIITTAALTTGIVAALLSAGPAHADSTGPNKFEPAVVEEFPGQTVGYWGRYMCTKHALPQARANAHGGYLYDKYCA